jgi:hypothetical protein
MEDIKMKTGVTFYPKRLRRKYKACLKVNGKTTHLGYFPSEEEAHQAYLKAKAEKNK